MIEYCGNMKHNENNYNKMDSSRGTINKGKKTFLDITSPSMMQECVNKKHN